MTDEYKPLNMQGHANTWQEEIEELKALVLIADLLRDILAVQRDILAKLAQSTDSRSSVEIKTSTRGVDIAAKSYADSDVCAQVGPAVLAYFEGRGRRSTMAEATA